MSSLVDDNRETERERERERKAVQRISKSDTHTKMGVLLLLSSQEEEATTNQEEKAFEATKRGDNDAGLVRSSWKQGKRR